MRPALVDALAGALGTDAFGWLVPTAFIFYPLAMCAVAFLFVRRTRVSGLFRYHALGAVVWTGLGGLLGSRLLYLLLHVDQLLAEPRILLDVGGASMSFGAYLGSIAGFVGYFARERIPVWPYGDVMASAIGIGPAIGRLSCFMAGDDFGTITTVPWAVTYPPGSDAFHSHVARGLLDPSSTASLPVHPVQLYLAANGLVLLAVFTWLWRRGRYRPGELLIGYWAAYGATRFCWEFFRGDQARRFVMGLPDAQIIAAAICLASVAILIVRRRRAGGQSPPVSESPSAAAPGSAIRT